VKILILGGSGQLGRSLIEYRWDDDVTLSAPLRQELDVLDHKAVRDFVVELKPDYLINASAWTNVAAAEAEVTGATELNSGAVENLANICRESDIPLIHVSTDYVFDGLKGTAYLESDSPNPQSAYGKSKYLGEEAISNSEAIKFYVIRTSWLYSKHGKNFVKTIVAKALSNQPVSIVDDQFGSPTFAGDLAAGIASITGVKPKYGIYHFSNLGRISWFDLGRAIYEEVGSDVKLVTSRKTEASELKRPVDSTLDTKKWRDSNLLQIPEWRASLKREMPSIQKTVESEITS
jgi:dTDP-4-dehydrorhamnose reductase